MEYTSIPVCSKTERVGNTGVPHGITAIKTERAISKSDPNKSNIFPHPNKVDTYDLHPWVYRATDHRGSRISGVVYV